MGKPPARLVTELDALTQVARGYSRPVGSPVDFPESRVCESSRGATTAGIHGAEARSNRLCEKNHGRTGGGRGAYGAATGDLWAFDPIDDGGLAIKVAYTEGPAIRVALASWSHVLCHPDPDDPAATDEWLALALDLIGGALVGRVQIVETFAGGQRVRVRAQVRHGRQWVTFDEQTGSLAARLRGLLGATDQCCCNQIDAPASYAPSDIAETGLVWARWAGCAGFWYADGPVWNRRGEQGLHVEIDGILDLHQYKPKQVKRVVQSYLDACTEAGVTQVRIIHGKGIGNLRRTVHALLDRDTRVSGYRLGGAGEGSWGATIVDLTSTSAARDR